jgi:HlyD family secretion protein
MNPEVDLRGFRSGGVASSAGTLVEPPRRVVARYVVPGALLLGFAGLGAYAMRDALTPAHEVRVVMPAQMRAAPSESGGAAFFQAPGWVEPDPFAVTVAALTPGIIRSVNVLEGERVTTGAVVAELVDEDARIAVSQAEALLAKRRAELTAAKDSWDNPTDLKERVRTTEAEARRLEAQLADARRALDLAREQSGIDHELSGSGALGRFSATQTASAARAAEIAIAETEAQIAATSSTLEAARENLGLRIADRQRLATADSEVKEGEAMLEEARLRLTRTRIVTPAGGTVMRLFATPGSMMAPDVMQGMRVCAVYDPQHLQVRAEVPLADAAKIAPGLSAEIRLESRPDRFYRGELTRIVHEADVQRNTLPVKVRVLDPDGDLKPEMITRVQFLSPRTEGAARETSAAVSATALFLPANLGPQSGGDGELWVAAAGRRAEKRAVRWGERTSGGLREVAAGIAPTDKVIISGTDNLKPGARVAPKEEIQ